MSEQLERHSTTTCTGIWTRAGIAWVPLHIVIDMSPDDVAMVLDVYPDRFELDGETVTDAEVIAALKAAAARLDAMDPRKAEGE